MTEKSWLVLAGESVTADGSPDYGFFGPASLVWQVWSSPAMAAPFLQVLLLLEFPYRPLQAIPMQHDPIFQAARRGTGSPSMVWSRYQRTFGLMLPMVGGDSRSAQIMGRQLRNYHRGMTASVPGDKPGTQVHYDAQSAELVVFAHVTIFDAALRAYEALTFRNHWRPRRLSKADRDRYWAEAVPFAELNGAPAGLAPDSADAVTWYYQSIAADYRDAPNGGLRSLLRNGPVVYRVRSFEQIRDLLKMTAVSLLATPAAVGVLPRPIRRMWNIPRAADPLFTLLTFVNALLWIPLSRPVFGDRFIKFSFGNDAYRLMRNMRQQIQAASVDENTTQPSK